MMSSKVCIQKWNLVLSKFVATLIAITTASVSHADIVVMDDVNIAFGNDFTFMHLGDDTFDFDNGRLGSPSFIGAPMSQTIGIFNSGGFGGPSPVINTPAFTQGTDLNVNAGTDQIAFVSGGTFVNGAAAGLNYLRLDLDEDGDFETVVEFDFGATPDTTGDLLTAFAFNDDGSSLDIAAASNALITARAAAAAAVPEPSSLAMLGAASVLLPMRLRRRRTKKDVEKNSESV